MGEPDKEVIKAASDEVAKEFRTLVDQKAIDTLQQTQHLILGRLQDSNAVLSHFNELSESCYTDVMADFSKNTKVMKSMKADLDHIFLKLRSMKQRISDAYPDAFPSEASEVDDTRPDLEVPVGVRTQEDQ